MKKVRWEWVGFSVSLGTFIGLEVYAIMTKKIRPFSHFVKSVQVNETTRYTLMGAWMGFCAWTIKHFFFEEE